MKKSRAEKICGSMTNLTEALTKCYPCDLCNEPVEDDMEGIVAENQGDCEREEGE